MAITVTPNRFAEMFGYPAPAGRAVTKLKEGAPADLVLLDPAVLRGLARDGKVVEASITDAFQSRIGAAVRAGAPKPDISTSAALRQTLLDAFTVRLFSLYKAIVLMPIITHSPLSCIASAPPTTLWPLGGQQCQSPR